MTGVSTAPRDGFIFAATGPKYIALARRAARNLRAVWPEIAIDLFCDIPPDDPIFDQIHILRDRTHRPKWEALLRSRFARSYCLDSDVVAVAHAPEMFEILATHDIAGAHDQFGNAPIAFLEEQPDIPLCFRQINGGVLGVRRSDKTDAFIRDLKTRFVAEKRDLEQPLLREMLFHGDLKLAVLPVEYNMMYVPTLTHGSPRMLAPRFLHITSLHVGDDHIQTPEEPFDLPELLGEMSTHRLRQRLEGDRSLGAKPTLRDLASEKVRAVPGGGLLMRKLAGRLRWLK